MDTVSSQPGDLTLPLSTAQPPGATSSATRVSGVSLSLIQEFWLTAEAEACELTLAEFSSILEAIGAKFNFGHPPGALPGPDQKAAFFRSLRLPELALAHACALGREAAWQHFVRTYQTSLTKAAIAITGSATLGQDLAESLYAELYGLREVDGERQSPLASYSGRGTLLGWLRTTLAQRHVDHHRRTRRENPLESMDVPAPDSATLTIPAQLAQLTHAVGRTFEALAAEDRFLLASYFLDRRTLLQLARTLNVHEATISRRLKRLVADMHKQLLHNLQSGGLSRRAAEEALGTDPRDIEINLRALLQSSQIVSFSDKTGSTPTAASGQP